MLAPKDAKIVVRQTLGATNFAVGETVSQATSGATGEVEHRVEIARGGNFKWTRLYLVNCTGTFVDNTAFTITGTTTSTTGLITYISITEAILAADFRPDLVSYPSEGEIATLPYEHEVFSENPYASESVSVTNNVVYGYEGSIGLIPAEDVWFEHRTQPQVINHYNTEVIIKEVEKQVEKVREVEKIVEVEIHKCGGDPVVILPPPPLPPEPTPPITPKVTKKPVPAVLPPPPVIFTFEVAVEEGVPPDLPEDAIAPEEEKPPAGYVFGHGGGLNPGGFGGGVTWKGGDNESIAGFAFQDVNQI